MARFCEMVRRGLVDGGDEVTVLRPQPVFARIPAPAPVRKWLGYLDKYLLFPLALLRKVESWEVVHICDHANSVYCRFLRGRPHIVTCHDLLAVRSALGEIPENPTGWSGRILQRAILRGLQRAQLVACVSESTRHDLLRLAKRDPERTSCISNGLNYPYHPIDRVEASQRIGRLLAAQTDAGFRPFFLHVGGNQWYKNRLGALRIFACLRMRPEFSGHMLVMAGKPFTAEMRALIASHGLGEAVAEMMSVSNEDLNALYSLAEGLIFPSLAEGFGWPIVEAQACGCPVFTSDRSPMNEIGGNAAAYFEPGDPSGAAAVISEALAERPRMVQAGSENARRFDAESMVKGYREAYEHCRRMQAVV